MNPGTRVRLTPEAASWAREEDRDGIYVVLNFNATCVQLHREPVDWRAMPELWARGLFDAAFEIVPPPTRFDRV